MRKSEVYSWRVEPNMKSALEDAARSERTSVGTVARPESCVSGYCERKESTLHEESQQLRIHEEAARYVGSLDCSAKGPTAPRECGNASVEAERRMQPRGLVDTGALLALLDRSDSWHQRCAESFAMLRLPLATTAAVLAEVFHFRRRLTPGRCRRRLICIRTDAFTVLPITDDDLQPIEYLMKKYADRPMDFADATLVRLAERESLSTVFTIDHDDFETYRIHGRSRFRILPAR